MRREVLLQLVATLAMTACATQGRSATADPDAALPGPGTEGTGEPVDSTGEPVELSCSPVSVGSLRTSAGDIIYHGQEVAVTATHRSEDGCLLSIEATWSIDGGCVFSVKLDGASGAWTLAKAAFAPDEKCGEYWPAERLDTHAWTPDDSRAALTASPATDAAEACAPGPELELIGRLEFAGQAGPLQAWVDGLGIGGDFETMAKDAGSCPASPALCEGLSCGEDAFGSACGACDEGLDCVEGACVDSPCPPDGPYGTQEGDTLTDVVLQDCDGNDVSFHDLCGADAGYVNLFAAW